MYKNKQSGTSALEASLLIPVFILLIGAIVDIARWYNLHIQVSRIAYEGARYGASLNGLSEHNPGNEDNFSPNNYNHGVDSQIYTRIDILRESRGIPADKFSSKAYRTSVPDTKGDLVKVEIQMQFEPIFSVFFWNKNVKSRARAPYLYRNS